MNCTILYSFKMEKCRSRKRKWHLATVCRLYLPGYGSCNATLLQGSPRPRQFSCILLLLKSDKNLIKLTLIFHGYFNSYSLKQITRTVKYFNGRLWCYQSQKRFYQIAFSAEKLIDFVSLKWSLLRSFQLSLVNF